MSWVSTAQDGERNLGLNQHIQGNELQKGYIININQLSTMNNVTVTFKIKLAAFLPIKYL